MKLSIAAIAYVEKKGVARTLIFNVNRFVRLMSDVECASITRDDLDKFIVVAVTAGLSKDSIWGTIKDLRTVLTDLGITLDWPTVKRPHPEPKPTALDDLSAVWVHCDPWLKQHMALTFHCCFRLADVIALQSSGVPADAAEIRLTAHKTGRNHVFPVPAWLRPLLGAVKLPFFESEDWAQKIVRKALASACVSAKVAQIYPRNIRQSGITAWSRANGMAGEIAHGSGLGSSVLKHYVSPLQVLESAMPRVTVPVAWRGSIEVSEEDTVLAAFRRLDPEAQRMVSSMAERLAR